MKQENKIEKALSPYVNADGIGVYPILPEGMRKCTWQEMKILPVGTPFLLLAPEKYYEVYYIRIFSDRFELCQLAERGLIFIKS